MNGLRKCGLYTMEFSSTVRKNETMWFEGKWMELEGIMLGEISQMWKTDPKDKRIHKTKHDHIHIYM
jgi:hypothetical protein